MTNSHEIRIVVREMAAITSGGGSKPSSRKSSPTRRRDLLRQTVSYFTVPPRAHLFTGSQSGSSSQNIMGQSVSQLFHCPTPRSPPALANRQSGSAAPVPIVPFNHNIMGTNWRNPIQLLYCTVHGTVLDVAHTDSQTCHHNTLQQSALRNNTASSQALVPCSLLHAPDGRSRPVRTEAGLHNVPHPAALARSRTSDRI